MSLVGSFPWRWLMREYRLDQRTAHKYLEELKFTGDIKVGKDRKLHSTKRPPF